MCKLSELKETHSRSHNHGLRTVVNNIDSLLNCSNLVIKIVRINCIKLCANFAEVQS